MPRSAAGKVFFVNGYGALGSDANNGNDPDLPLKTLTAAIGKCVANRGDVIIVLNYWQPTGETWPITINKNQVHIVGMAQPGLPFPVIHPPADTAAFQLASSGQYGSISFLTIGGGVSHGGIEWGNAGQVDGYYLHDLLLGHAWFGTPLHGIYQPAASTRGGYGNRVERCKFLGDQANCAGAITGNGNELAEAAQKFDGLEVIDCIFQGLAIGINAAFLQDAVITGCKFVIPDLADGEAITLQAACLGCLVDGCVAMNGGDAVVTQQPYRDVAAGASNHWGVNWATNAVDLPKQA